MLCDDAAKAMRGLDEVAEFATGENTWETKKGASTLTRAISNAQRFVLSPLTVETCTQLCTDGKAISRTRDYLFTPAELTWVEWSGNTPGGHPLATRHGFILIGQSATKSNLVLGWGCYFYSDPRPGGAVDIICLPITYDFPAINRPLVRWLHVDPMDIAARSASPEDWKNATMIDNKALGDFLAAALALINTPRLSYSVDYSHDKINLLRRRLARPPVLSYREVKIAIDRGSLGFGPQLSATGDRALHHVRTFLRLKRGRVEIVRPHWRGNPRFGVIQHRYIAFRAEDEPGPWQGGPLPGPSMISRLEDEKNQ